MPSPFREEPFTATQSSAADTPVFTQQDAEHLRLLSIFHYVLAAFGVLFGFAPVIHMSIGAVMLFAPELMEGPQQQSPEPFRFIGLAFLGGGCCFMLIAWIMAGLEVYAGRSLAAHRNHTFCTVIAALNCMWIPMGTVLGIFTILVLIRPGVKSRFEHVTADPFN